MTYHGMGATNVPSFPYPSFPYRTEKVPFPIGLITQAEKDAAEQACLRKQARAVNGIGAVALRRGQNYSDEWAERFFTSRWSNHDPCVVKNFGLLPSCLNQQQYESFAICISGCPPEMSKQQCDLAGAMCAGVLPGLAAPLCSGVRTELPLPDCHDEQWTEGIQYCGRYPNYLTGPSPAQNALCWTAKKDTSYWSALNRLAPCCLKDPLFDSVTYCERNPQGTANIPGAPAFSCPVAMAAPGWDAMAAAPACSGKERIPECFDETTFDYITDCERDPSTNRMCGRTSPEGWTWPDLVATPACNGKERLPACYDDATFDGITACEIDPSTDSGCGQPYRGNAWADILEIPACSGKARAFPQPEPAPPAPPPPMVQDEPAPPPAFIPTPSPDITPSRRPQEREEEGFGMWGILALVAVAGGGAYYLSTRKE